MKNNTNETLNYYNTNFGAFSASTKDLEFHEVQDRFLKYMPQNASILDFGCGTGRDSKYFLSKGYVVEAMDGSVEMCRIASENSGLDVKCKLFNELNEKNKYDGIWACSSILHLGMEELHSVFEVMIIALKYNGYIYTSFKYGEFSGMRNGRFFTDMNEKIFDEFLNKHNSLGISEEWISSDIRPGRENEKWLNVILKKNS